MIYRALNGLPPGLWLVATVAGMVGWCLRKWSLYMLLRDDRDHARIEAMLRARNAV